MRPVPIPPPPSQPSPQAVRAVIALGSNLGDRREILASALEALKRLPLTDSVVMAEPIESVALTLDGLDETKPAYLNSVAIISTRLAPSMLLAHLQTIEREHGRERIERWGDRTLDLDIVSYGDVQSSDEPLTLPHPRAVERDFVLVPWLSLDPEAVVPGAGRVDELLEKLRSAE